MVGRVPGYPDLGSQGQSQYTPQIYAKKLLIKFYSATVFGEIANRDYEGEISKVGDKVIIRTRPTVVVDDYVKGMDLDTIRQTPESDTVELLIDKAKVYSVQIDDIDRLQNDIQALEEWSADGGEQLALSIDRSILGSFYADADTLNTGLTAGKVSGSYNMGVTGTPVALTKSNILDYIVYCDAVLSEQDVPKTGRWMVLPEWALAQINTSDLRSALFTGDQSNQNLRNGKIGQISNFTIYGSNNLTGVTDGADTCWNIPFGHKCALTFASQLVKNRTLELQKTFATVQEGLQVYGWEVVKPEALGVLYAKKG
jgi:hypothetical protein